MNLVRTRVAGRKWEGQEISKNWGNTPEGNTRNTGKETVSWALLSCLQLFFQLGYSCFTMLCWFLLYNEVNQPYIHVYSLPLDSPPSVPSPCHPLGHHRASSWAPCAIQQIPTSALFYTQQCVYVSVNLLIRCTPFPALCVDTSILYICVCIPALQIGSSVPFF